MTQIKAKLIIYTDDALLNTQTFDKLTELHLFMKECINGINDPVKPDELNIDIIMEPKD